MEIKDLIVGEIGFSKQCNGYILFSSYMIKDDYRVLSHDGKVVAKLERGRKYTEEEILAEIRKTVKKIEIEDFVQLDKDILVHNQWYETNRELCFYLNHIGAFSVKDTNNGRTLYDSGGKVIARLRKDYVYSQDEFIDLIEKGNRAIEQRSIARIAKKDPLIGAMFEEISKKYPIAYFKHGTKNSPNFVAIPFPFITVYVGVSNDKYIVKFNSPETGESYMAGDLVDPKLDPIKKAMEILSNFKRVEGMLKKIN